MKKCPKCGEMLGDQVDSCSKCGYKYSYDKDLLKIKSLNDLYEYKVVPVMDDSTGTLDTNQLSVILNGNAFNGWRLKNVITNEIGKNATTIGYAGISGSTNATIDMTILIFERKVKSAAEIEHEVQDKLSIIEKEEQIQMEEKGKRIIEEKEKRIEEIKSSLSKIEEEILNVFEESGQIIALNDISSALDDKYSTMELLTYLQRLVDAGKLEKESKNYKLV